MLSKCANPGCSEQFRYLHQGRLFQLAPTPAVASSNVPFDVVHERFWLCDRCAKSMSLVWDGNQAKIVKLPAAPNPTFRTGNLDNPLKRRAAHAGRQSR